MDDLISRQAAIDALQSAKYPNKDIRSDFDLGRNAGLTYAAVIVDGLPTAQPEPCEDAVSRQAVIKITEETGALETQWRVKELPSVTPKQRTGKWIQDWYGAWSCSECGEPCASQVMGKPRDRFCKWCGAKMGVTE